jgi:hypothetical protein
VHEDLPQPKSALDAQRNLSPISYKDGPEHGGHANRISSWPA